MKTINYIYIILSIFFQSLAGIIGKFAALTIQENNIITMMTIFYYLISLLLLFLQAIVWQQALEHFPLSFAYPFMSLVYFFILFASATFFHEGITTANIIGFILISFGITIASSKKGEKICFSL